MLDPYADNLVSIETLDSVVLVSMRGEWDLSVADQLCRTFGRISTKKDVVIDLRAVAFLDSTGLSHIMQLHRRLAFAGRRLETISTGIVKRLLAISALDRLVGISPERLSWIDSRRSGSRSALGVWG